MSEHATAWGFLLVIAVAGTIGLFHAGVNVGGSLAGFVQSVEHLFGSPLRW